MTVREWIHHFTPQFSSLLAITFIAILVIAYISGRKSVRVRPRRVGNGNREKGRPSYRSSKVSSVKAQFKRGFTRRQRLADSVIEFCSETKDYFWSIMAGIVFMVVFFKEHWDGLVQIILNFIDPSAHAAWADIFAFAALGVMGFIIGAAFYVIRQFAQRQKACKLASIYLYKLHARPILVEKKPIWFQIELIIFDVKKMIEERQNKEKEKEDHLSRIIAMSERKRMV